MTCRGCVHDRVNKTDSPFADTNSPMNVRTSQPGTKAVSHGRIAEVGHSLRSS